MPTILGESSLGAKYLVVQLVFSPYILLDDSHHQFFCGEELYDKKNTLSMCIKHEVTPT